MTADVTLRRTHSLAATGLSGWRGLPGLGISYENVADGFGVSEAGGGGAAADELAWWRPLGDMLVAGGVVVTDEGHFADGDGEQMEPARLGTPSQAGGDCGGIAA